MTRLVVLQPSFLPWLGHLDWYHGADTFVLYDDVQFAKNFVSYLSVIDLLFAKGPRALDILSRS